MTHQLIVPRDKEGNMIPKLSSPLAKSFRTLEGLLVAASNAVLVVVPIVTHSLSAGTSVKYGVILNSVYAGSRSVLKGVAAFSQVTGVQPDEKINQDTQAALDQILKSLETESTGVTPETQPSPPAQEPSHGLSPTPVPVAVPPAPPTSSPQQSST